MADIVINLETIEVFSQIDGDLRNVSIDADLSISSIYPGTESLVDSKKFLDPTNQTLGIHTENSSKEWICLNLHDEFFLSEIILYNRDDVCASRAWQLIIEISVDGEDWTPIYSHLGRLQQYFECVAHAIRHNSIPSSDRPLVNACLDILKSLLFQEYYEAIRLLSCIEGLQINTLNEIRSGFTRELLVLTQNQWSGHGISRSFRYWTLDEKKDYLTQSMNLIDDLRILTPHICLGFGFVLAYVRDGDLIPHDDDIDIILTFNKVDCPSISMALDIVCEYLEKLGYTVSSKYFSHCWITKPGGNGVDVFVGLDEGGLTSWYPSSRNILEMSDIFPPLEVELFSVKCLIPRNPLKYLERKYGAEWRSPDKNFSHPWNELEYEDIR
ncbi:discoidin domain-containing protein [Methylobacter sp.]|uniref:discoidin domain-containing protein n=1 Tax=Methylobacter sp. TaxID=2051955 RepID=UPI002FDD5079